MQYWHNPERLKRPSEYNATFVPKTTKHVFQNTVHKEILLYNWLTDNYSDWSLSHWKRPLFRLFFSVCFKI